jgi:twitching motility protein PilJ
MIRAKSAANGQTAASNDESKIACEALAAARGVYAPLTGAHAGQADAFGSLKVSVDSLSGRLQALSNFSQDFPETSTRLARDVNFFAGSRDTLVAARASLVALRTQPLELSALLDRLSTEELANRSPAARIAAAQELRLIAQRISRSATELGVPGNLNRERVFQLSKDSANFTELVSGLLEGNPNLRLQQTRLPTTRKLLMEVSERYEPTRTSAGIVLRSIRELVGAQVVHANMASTLKDVEAIVGPVCGQASDQ